MGQEVPRAVVDHIARTLTIPGERYLQYDLEGRSARYHKEQIRQWTGFRVGTTADADAITTWLCAHTRVDDATPARLTVQALERYNALRGAVKVFLLLFRLISPGCAGVVRCGG
jgi:hypothetical protein